MSEVIDIFKELLRFRSVTPNDDGALNYIDMLMDGFEARFIEKGGVKNLLLTKRFGGGAHLCFAGHIDVVPAGEGWETSPFEPVEKDGFVYARGAQDMKSGVAAMLAACKNASFNGALSILLTSDEEGDGIYGTREVLRVLAEEDALPDFAVIAEPTSEASLGDALKVGRRGSINGVLSIKGVQGHAAYPEKCVNPAHQLAHVFANFAGRELDGGSKYFAASKVVITDIRGGIEVTNVTPASVKIMFNVRNSDLTSLEDVRACVENVFAGLDYDLNLKQGAKPFLTDENSKIVSVAKAAVSEVCGAEPRLSTSGGTSDARFFAARNVPVVELGVLNDRIHAANERVAIADVEGLAKIFGKIIEKMRG